MENDNNTFRIDADLPAGLHDGIMAALIWIKWRFRMISTAALLSAGFLYLLYDVSFKIVDSSAASVIKEMALGFDLSLGYAADSISGLLEILPMPEICALSISAILTAAAISIIFKFHYNFKKLN